MEIPEHKKLGTPRDLATIFAKYLLANRYKFKKTSINSVKKEATVSIIIDTDIKGGKKYFSNISFPAIKILLPSFSLVEFDMNPKPAMEGLRSFPVSRTYNLPISEAEEMPDGQQGEFLKKYFLWQLSIAICENLDDLTKKKMSQKFKDPREKSKTKKIINRLKNIKYHFTNKKYNRYLSK